MIDRTKFFYTKYSYDLINNLWCFPFYLLTIGAAPYLFLISAVQDSYFMLTPYFYAVVFLLIGSRIKLKFNFQSDFKVALSENQLFCCILLLALVELAVAGNLPAVSLYVVKYVAHTDYGIPLIHSLFNSLCFLFILFYYTQPCVCDVPIKKSSVRKCLLISTYVFLTFQRLAFVHLLVAFVLPSALNVFIRLKYIFLFLTINKFNIRALALTLLVFFIVFSLLYVGWIRNDLSNFVFA